jgi:Protein of unknown function (DUF3987)
MTPRADDLRRNPAIAQLAKLGRRFVGWEETPNPDLTKPPRKIPIRPLDGKAASSTDPDDWGTLDDALAAVARYRLRGIGVVLGDGLAGVDFDTCIDPQTKRLTPWSRLWLKQLATYAEVSPSGEGVKALCFVDPALELRANKRMMGQGSNGSSHHPPQIELYTRGRYFTLTGEQLDGTTDEVVDATEAFERLAAFVADGRSGPGGGTASANGHAYFTEMSEATAKLLDDEPELKAAWTSGTKLTAGGDSSASGLDFSLMIWLVEHGYDDSAIEAALRSYPHGQIGRGSLDEKGAARRIAQLLAEAEKRRKGSGEGEWPDPAPLPEGLPAVQAFDFLLLPDSLRPWIADVTERMQTPPDYPGVAAMVTISAIVGRKVGIRPKRHDDWMVTPNLWGAVIGRPGVMKTPALQEACRPLTLLEIEAQKNHAAELKEHDAQQQIAKAQKKIREEKIAKDLRQNRDPKGILHDLLAEGLEEPPPARRRYIVNDTSIEKLGEILGQNPRGVLVFRDELVGFLRQMDRDGHEQDRAFYLESWNGNGRFTYDRIGRGTLDIEACCVSLLGGIQPGPLAGYLDQMARGGIGDDGLIQRMQLLVWPDVDRVWHNVDRPPDRRARRIASELFSRLDAFDPVALGIGQDDTEGAVPLLHEAGTIPCLRFDPGAQVAFDAWRAGLEGRLRTGELHSALEAHLSKYRSLVPSLALLCHLADNGGGPVGPVAVQRALAWAEYLVVRGRQKIPSGCEPPAPLARGREPRQRYQLSASHH